MRAIWKTFTGAALLVAAASPASARGPWSWNPHYEADHAALHDELDHRDFHRELYHREAHRYPMTPWEHEQLHDELSHQAYHDELSHRAYHRGYEPRPRGGCGNGGIGVRGKHVSFWFGF